MNIRNAVEESRGLPLIDAGGRDGIVIQDSTKVEIGGLQIANTSIAMESRRVRCISVFGEGSLAS